MGGVRPTQHNRVLNTTHVFGGGDGCAMGDAKNEVAGYGMGKADLHIFGTCPSRSVYTEQTCGLARRCSTAWLHALPAAIEADLQAQQSEG